MTFPPFPTPSGGGHNKDGVTSLNELKSKIEEVRTLLRIATEILSKVEESLERVGNE
ncbi:MAG: hypothetical protein KDB01_10510 [Planctomycetaceae bacterium]|nr:hypothetical protein [Planctomycetaceae bacterium]